MSTPAVGPTGPENPGERRITEPVLGSEENAPETEENAELIENPVAAVGPTGPENP